MIKDHPEIEDMIYPVDETPLELPAHDHFTHLVADTVLAVNDEHYSVIYLGTGILNYIRRNTLILFRLNKERIKHFKPKWYK